MVGAIVGLLVGFHVGVAVVGFNVGKAVGNNDDSTAVPTDVGETVGWVSM